MASLKLRRLRQNRQIRDLLSESRLSIQDLIMPYFVIAGRDKREPVKTMPGVFRLSLDNLIRDIREIQGLGIKGVLIFGVAQKKDARGTAAYSPDGIVQKATKEIKRQIKDIIIMTDVCLCGYTFHGHCGIVRGLQNFIIDNDETLKSLAKIALSHAKAGADFVAPSAMMDGQVKAIRDLLDKNGFLNTGILAYSAKYASNFYWPFREALGSQPQFGDRKTYQMDYRNSDEALREIGQDIQEGADMVMVKPALSYLDIIYRAKQRFNVPLAAYNVSGEYSLIKSAVGKGLVNEKDITLEILTSIKRAGADLIISYHAKEVAKWLKS